MAVLDPVVLGLAPARVARQPAALAQVGEVVARAGDDLVHVGLVAGVPQDDVAGRVEDPVQGEGQLDHAEVGAEVPAGRPRPTATMNSRISAASCVSCVEVERP